MRNNSLVFPCRIRPASDPPAPQAVDHKRCPHCGLRIFYDWVHFLNFTSDDLKERRTIGIQLLDPIPLILAISSKFSGRFWAISIKVLSLKTIWQEHPPVPPKIAAWPLAQTKAVHPHPTQVSLHLVVIFQPSACPCAM